MTQITLQMLKDMNPGIFASGEFIYDGLNKKWIATRGGIHDWAIYYGEPYASLQDIKDWGAKLHDIEKVKELIDCDKEALEMYRH